MLRCAGGPHPSCEACTCKGIPIPLCTAARALLHAAAFKAQGGCSARPQADVLRRFWQVAWLLQTATAAFDSFIMAPHAFKYLIVGPEAMAVPQQSAACLLISQKIARATTASDPRSKQCGGSQFKHVSFLLSFVYRLYSSAFVFLEGVEAARRRWVDCRRSNRWPPSSHELRSRDVSFGTSPWRAEYRWSAGCRQCCCLAMAGDLSHI